MRVTKGDIVIECADQAELAIALAVLNGPQSDVPALPEVTVPAVTFGPLRAELFEPDTTPMPAPADMLDCAMGTGYLGEYLSAEDERRLTLVPAIEDLTEKFAAADVLAQQHIPVKSISQCNKDVLDALILFAQPEGVYAKTIADVLDINMTTASSRLHTLKEQGLADTMPNNRRRWHATQLARQSKLVAC